MQVNEFYLDLKKFDFRNNIQGLIETSMMQSELKGLQFSIYIDKNVPKQIISDPKKILNVLFILISKSIKHTSVGSIKVEIKKK